MEMDWNDVPKAERYLGTTDEWRQSIMGRPVARISNMENNWEFEFIEHLKLKIDGS